MHSLAQRVLSHIRRQELLKAGDRVGVAVSGGIDSVALLGLLLELRGDLGIVVSVVHFNHKLRGAESDADEQFVASLAREHGLEFYVESEDVSQHSYREHVSVEAAARELRYGFFRQLLGQSGSQGLKPERLIEHYGTAEAVPFPNDPASRGLEGPLLHHLDRVCTGHTLDDQAETVLMHVIRGTGTRGLGAIHPRIVVEDGRGEISRPLMGIRRRELKAYLFDIRQEWREDSSNADNSFTRNRVRKLLIPLLEKEFNPSVSDSLAELAEIARDEEDFWDNEVAGWMGTAVHWSEPDWAKASNAAGLIQIASLYKPSSNGPTSAAKGAAGMAHPLQNDSELQARIDSAPWLVANASVDRVWFLGEPAAVQRRLIKAIGERAGIPLEFKHVEEIRRCTDSDASGKEVSLPLGWKMVGEPHELLFVTPDLRQAAPAEAYAYEIPVPGQAVISQINSVFEVQLLSAGDASRHDPDQLLDGKAVAGPLQVRNWRPGDRFWPAHTKSPKKVKELLQKMRVAELERKLWPVVLGGDELVWMRGFPTPARLQPRPGSDAILITEKTQEGCPET